MSRACTVEPGHSVNYGAKIREIASAAQQGLTGEDGWPILEEAITIERRASDEARQRYGESDDRQGFPACISHGL